MVYYWKCCGCGREVSHFAWGDTCPDCAHVKCGNCTDAYHPPPNPPPRPSEECLGRFENKSDAKIRGGVHFLANTCNACQFSRGYYCLCAYICEWSPYLLGRFLLCLYLDDFGELRNILTFAHIQDFLVENEKRGRGVLLDQMEPIPTRIAKLSP